MKQVKFNFLLAAMVALSVGFSSCNNDDDNPLVGSTWVFTESGDGWSDTVTNRFITGTTGTLTIVSNEGGSTRNETFPFTYTFNAPTVRITVTVEETYTMTGTVSGSRMTFISDGETQVFIRQ